LAGIESVRARRRPRRFDLPAEIAGGLMVMGTMPLSRIANDVTALSDRRVKATRREFLGRSTALAANPNTMLACNGPITDPAIALIAEEKRWRFLAVAAREGRETPIRVTQE
jgi:hypothetical protein